MLLASLLSTGAVEASNGSTEAPYSLRLLPDRSNACLDADLETIEIVLQSLFQRQLPYEPYKTRFNGLQADAEVFRAIFPRPLPGEPDALVTKQLTQEQWETVERLKAGLNTLRSDLARASQLFDDIKALPTTERPTLPNLPGWRGFLSGLVTLPAVGSTTSKAPLISRTGLAHEAMISLRDGRLDEAATRLQAAQTLWNVRPANAGELKLETVAGS